MVEPKPEKSLEMEPTISQDIKKPVINPRTTKSSEEKKSVEIPDLPDDEKSKQAKNQPVRNPRALNNRKVKPIDPESLIGQATSVTSTNKISSNNDQLPNFRMAPASTANVPGIDNKKSGKIQTQTSISKDSNIDNDEDDDVLVIQDLSLFSDKPKVVPKRKIVKPKLNPGYLTPQEIQILEQAAKAKEDEAKKLELMEEKKRKDLNEIRIQRKADENARLAKTRELKIEKDVRAKAIKKSMEAPRPTTEDLRHSVSQMT